MPGAKCSICHARSAAERECVAECLVELPQRVGKSSRRGPLHAKRGHHAHGLLGHLGTPCHPAYAVGAAVGPLVGRGLDLHAAIGTAAVLLVVGGLRPVSKALDLLRVRSEGVPGEYRVRVAYGAKDDAAVRAALTGYGTAQPGLAVTALTARPAVDGVSWRTWHAYPQVGELVWTSSVVRPR